jgi:hypothetical protein
MRIVVALVLAAACGGKKDEPPPPTCEQVTDHLLSIMQMPNHPGMSMGNKKAMVQQCLDRKQDAKTLACMNAATTMPAVAACSGERPHVRPAMGSGSGS